MGAADYGLRVDQQLVAFLDSVSQKADALFYITQKAFGRHLIDDVWREKVARSPRSLASIVLSDPVVAALRKELRQAKRPPSRCDNWWSNSSESP